MMRDGFTTLTQQPWLIWPPGVVVTLTVLAFGLLGDVARDAATERWQAVRVRPRDPSSPEPVRTQRPAAAANDHEIASAANHRRREKPAQSASSAGSLLSIDRLTVDFPGRTGPMRVVDEVSFDVARGETVGVVGESGCGKTMTAMAILGLLPGSGRITSGQITFDGLDLTRTSERGMGRIRGKEIALISQEPILALNPVFTVGTQLADRLRAHLGISRSAARVHALELLRKVQLPDPETVANRYPHELSGGMAQRVSIARALSGNPQLLIADEPTTALDVTIQAEILALLRDLQRQSGMAILLVSHDLGVVADACTRVRRRGRRTRLGRSDLRRAFASLYARAPVLESAWRRARQCPGNDSRCRAGFRVSAKGMSFSSAMRDGS